MLNKPIAIGYSQPYLDQKAKAMAGRLGLQVDNQALPRLLVTPDGLALLVEGFSPLFVDFSQSNWLERRKAGKKQGLVQACKPRPGLKIIDTTAGWGKDAAILASFGADVVMLERDPVMAVLLEDGLERLSEHSPLAKLLSLYLIDAETFLNNLSENELPDVIYIDPMHPARKKSALVKKEMQALHYWIRADEEPLSLLELAIRKARQRVVVKWPQRSAPLLTPSYAFSGKTVRFDVYKP